MNITLIRVRNTIMHTIFYLKACYNRQLLNIGCIVKEVVGVKYEVAKLLQRVL